MTYQNSGLLEQTKISPYQNSLIPSKLNHTVVTQHATRRAQQRGIPAEAIKLAACFGKQHRTSGGLFRRIIGKQELKKLGKLQFMPKSTLHKLEGLSVVTAENDDIRTVVTVIGKGARHKRLRS